MNEINLPVLDPWLVEAAGENLRKDMEASAEQAAKHMALLGGAFKSYFEQAAKALEDVGRRAS